MPLTKIGRVILTSLCFVLVFARLGQPQQDGSLRPGDVLDGSNWQKAEGLLPPGVFELYKSGDWANPVIEYPKGHRLGGQDFLEGTETNRGKFGVSDVGTLVDKATGKLPPYIIGFPFPDIDPADPQAAVKVIWNYCYQWWNNGNTEALINLDWVGTSGLDHHAVQEVRFLYYDAQPRELSPRENPHNLLLQGTALAVEPADVYGTAALNWRFRDGSKRDLLWAYVPALRRIRQVSPANRSDGFLGSDISQDDGPFFDGKAEDFTWKLLGEAEMLIPIDPESVKGNVKFKKLSGEGWEFVGINTPHMGYEVPDWKGVAWAPVGQALAKTKVWVIEAEPKDRYYLYGRIRLYIEQESFEGRWNIKFDWKGELMQAFFNGRGIKHSPDGKRYVDATPVGIMYGVNLKMRRATAAGPTTPPHTYTRYGTQLSPTLFEYQELMRIGK